MYTNKTISIVHVQLILYFYYNIVISLILNNLIRLHVLCTLSVLIVNEVTVIVNLWLLKMHP